VPPDLRGFSSKGKNVPKDELTQRLISFIRKRFLDGDPKNELDASTPLLEWGVLDSLNTAVLINFIRDDLGVTIPAQHISGRNFGCVNGISTLVAELSEAA
jgi:clorobiocin biosynthesis protein CloN5